ncbi:hypothetical protein ACWC4C_33210 [Streptomyces olivaceoviridis]
MEDEHKLREAGIRDGPKARICELGGPGKHGGALGDMYVTVHITD